MVVEPDDLCGLLHFGLHRRSMRQLAFSVVAAF